MNFDQWADEGSAGGGPDGDGELDLERAAQAQDRDGKID
jgi:hypothetical protein